MITYKIILDYLGVAPNTFSTPVNTILQYNNFTKFMNIFDSTYYRYGIIPSHNNINVSLTNSLNYCLSNIENTDNELHDIVDIWKLSNDIHINIIIFDFKINKIFATHYGDYFNPWRPTILLAKSDDIWEPIITSTTKIFTIYDNIILKNNILSQEIYRYNMNEIICINDNFKNIVEQYIDNDIDTNTIFINNTTFTKNKLDKMKKDELMQIVTNMNLVLNIAKPTKKDLINIIIGT